MLNFTSGQWCLVAGHYPVTTLELYFSVLCVLFATTYMQGIYLSRNRICRLHATKCSRSTSLDLLEVQLTALSNVTFVSVFAISRLSTNLSFPPRICSFTAVGGVVLG